MSNAFAQTDDYAPAPSGNAMALPDLPSDRTTTADQWARLLDTWAAMLGPGFSYKGGLQYENDDFRALLNNRGLQMRGPLAGGTWRGEVTEIGTGDPRFQFNYMKQFR